MLCCITCLVSIVKQLTTRILSQIALERDGEYINTSRIATVIASYVELGRAGPVSDPSYKTKNLDLYQKHFLDAFLKDTARYYSQERKGIMIINSF